MRGWVIYRSSATTLAPESYELDRLRSSALLHDIDLTVIRPEQVDLIVTRDDRKSILIDGEPTELPDFVLPRMGAGTTYFALAVIRHLERLGVFCLNSSTSIDTVKDKLYSQQILAERGIPVPKTMLVKFPVPVDLVEAQLGFPVVVKTLSGSQGSGVFLAETRRSFQDVMELVEAANHGANIILQEFVADSHGRDLRVVTVGGRVIATMERTGAEGNFKANYSAGGSVRAFETTPEIEWLATQTAQILGLEIAGIDLLFDGPHFKVCEANSSPGFKGLESVCDVDVPGEIFDFLRIRQGIFER